MFHDSDCVNVSIVLPVTLLYCIIPDNKLLLVYIFIILFTTVFKNITNTVFLFRSKNFFNDIFFYLMCTGVLPACYVGCEGIRSCGTGVTNDLKQPYGCWELDLGPWQVQQVLLTRLPL